MQLCVRFRDSELVCVCVCVGDLVVCLWGGGVGRIIWFGHFLCLSSSILVFHIYTP